MSTAFEAFQIDNDNDNYFLQELRRIDWLCLTTVDLLFGLSQDTEYLPISPLLRSVLGQSSDAAVVIIFLTRR